MMNELLLMIFRRRFFPSSYSRSINTDSALAPWLWETRNTLLFLALVPESPTLMCSNWRIRCALQDSIWMLFHGSMEIGHQFGVWQNTQPWKSPRLMWNSSARVILSHDWKKKPNLDVGFIHTFLTNLITFVTIYDINIRLTSDCITGQKMLSNVLQQQLWRERRFILMHSFWFVIASIATARLQ